MKPKTMILMIVAVSCGLGASYMTSRLLAERGDDTVKVPVLVAKKNLNMGDTIKIPEEMFIEKLFTSGEEPRSAIVDPAKLKNQVLKRSLRPGDFVTPDDLLDDKGGGIAYWLPKGHQAVGIRVSQDTIAGGFASLPHSRVNIISTQRRGGDKDTKAILLLENVLVLAADTQTQRDDTGRAMPANVVTVALKPEDVLKLELAKQLGTISLTLRGFNDSAKSEVTSLSAQQLNTGTTGKEPTEDIDIGPPMNVALPLPTPAKLETPATLKKDGPRHVMRIIEGDQQRQVPFAIDAPPVSPEGLPIPKKDD
jgi:pilus assembly protein CpaB